MSLAPKDKDILDLIKELEKRQRDLENGVTMIRPDPRFLKPIE